jgi:hypothetical protein
MTNSASNKHVSLSLFPSTQPPKFNFGLGCLDKMRLQIPFITPAFKVLKPSESGDYGFVASIGAVHGESLSPESETEPNSTT